MKVYSKNGLISRINNKNKLKTVYMDNTQKVAFIFDSMQSINYDEDFFINIKITDSGCTSWLIEIDVDGKKLSTTTAQKDFNLNPNELYKLSYKEPLPVGLRVMNINVKRVSTGKSIGEVVYTLMISEKEIVSNLTPRNKMPYLSTYYIKPIINPNEDIIIDYYVDDYEGSYYKEKDLTQKFTVIAHIDGKPDIILENVKAGDNQVNLGSFPSAIGEKEISIKCIDCDGKSSHILWNKVLVKEEDTVNEYIMTEDDLLKYNIKNMDDREIIKAIYIDNSEYEGHLHQSVLRLMEEKTRDYSVPSGKYTCFLADLDNDGVADYYTNCADKTYVKYADDYSKEDVATESENTRTGLQRFINDKVKAGYNKVKLLKGVYRVSHNTVGGRGYGSIYVDADNFTLDLNGSTIKLNGFTGDSGYILSLNFCKNSKIINGIIEGDMYTHDYENSLNGSEWVIGINIAGGCEYSGFEDIVLKRITGYGFHNGIAKTKDNSLGYEYPKFKSIGAFTNGDIDENGNETSCDDRSVSDFVDVQNQLEAYKTITGEEHSYISVNLYLGYQGNGMGNWNYILHFYDTNKNYLGMENSYQYRKTRVIEGTKFIRVVSLSDSSKVSKELTTALPIVPTNCWFKRMVVTDIRGTGAAIEGMRNMIIEDCDIIKCGQQITPTGIDLEDGWDMMQDCTIKNITYDCPNKDLLVAGGHNIIVENSNGGSVYIWGRVRNFVSRNCTFNKLSNIMNDGVTRTGNPRVYDNESSEVIQSVANENGKLNLVCIKDCVGLGGCDCHFLRGEYVALYDNSVYDNSIIKVNSDFLGYIRKKIDLNKCTFKPEIGYDGICKISFNGSEELSTFKECVFNMSTQLASHNSFLCGYFEGCNFSKGLMISPNVEIKDGNKITFKDCIINSNGKLINFAVNAYNEGKANIEFINCTINKTGNEPLIYGFATPKTGMILFENCEINVQDECKLYDCYSPNSNKYINLNIIFNSTPIPNNLINPVIENINIIKNRLESEVFE